MNIKHRDLDRRSIYNRVISSILFTVLTVTLVSQVLHVHSHNAAEVERCHYTADHSHESDDRSESDEDQNCPLCQFALSDFVETKLSELSPICENSRAIYTLYTQQEIFSPVDHTRGRSPPAILS